MRYIGIVCSILEKFLMLRDQFDSNGFKILFTCDSLLRHYSRWRLSSFYTFCFTVLRTVLCLVGLDFVKDVRFFFFLSFYFTNSVKFPCATSSSGLFLECIWVHIYHLHPQKGLLSLQLEHETTAPGFSKTLWHKCTLTWLSFQPDFHIHRMFQTHQTSTVCLF